MEPGVVPGGHRIPPALKRVSFRFLFLFIYLTWG